MALEFHFLIHIHPGFAQIVDLIAQHFSLQS
jgi:hypothetical protein